MKIFRLGAKLQIFVHNNGVTFKISQLTVGPIQRFVLGRKVTLRTLWTYKHYLRLLSMEWHPGAPFHSAARKYNMFVGSLLQSK